MNKIKKLFLDDIRNVDQIYRLSPSDQWRVVRDIDEFKKAVQEEFPDFISFDHDLCIAHMEYYVSCHQGTNRPIEYNKLPFNNGRTGYDCAKWLISYCESNNLDLPNYSVHSFNHIGKQNIIDLLENYKNQKNQKD